MKTAGERVMLEIAYLLGTMMFVAMNIYYLGGLAVVQTRNADLISFFSWVLVIPAAVAVAIAFLGIPLCVDLLRSIGVQAAVEDANLLANIALMAIGAVAAYWVYVFVERLVPAPHQE